MLMVFSIKIVVIFFKGFIYYCLHGKKCCCWIVFNEYTLVTFWLRELNLKTAEYGIFEMKIYTISQSGKKRVRCTMLHWFNNSKSQEYIIYVFAYFAIHSIRMSLLWLWCKGINSHVSPSCFNRLKKTNVFNESHAYCIQGEKSDAQRELPEYLDFRWSLLMILLLKVAVDVLCLFKKGKKRIMIDDAAMKFPRKCQFLDWKSEFLFSE